MQITSQALAALLAAGLSHWTSSNPSGPSSSKPWPWTSSATKSSTRTISSPGTAGPISTRKAARSSFSNTSAAWSLSVQYSVFECRLDEAEFTEFWLRLLSKIDEDEDRIVAYKIDARCAKETMTAGRMVCSEKSLCYLV